MSQTHSAMDPLNTYWTFFNITAAGHLQHQPHPTAQPHFATHITPFLPTQTANPKTANFQSANTDRTQPLSHRHIQQTLYTQHLDHLNPDGSDSGDSSVSAPETCLRCFISHGIDQACQQLASNFGTAHGFTKMELLAFALNDDRLLSSAKRPTSFPNSRLRSAQPSFQISGFEPLSHRSNRQASTRSATAPKSTYRSLTTQIFESFDPSASNLKTWTVRLLRQDKDINTVLLDHGVYLVSDWAILNDTSEPQLQRILSTFHVRSPLEVQQATLLLESYHTIYLRDRLNASTKGRCDRPSPQQLQRIQTYFNRLLEQAQDGNGTGLNRIALSDTKATLHHLQSLAQALREYRINVRRKTLPSQSLDAPESAQYSSQMVASDAENSDDHGVQDFLRIYRQLFLGCLDEAIATVIERKVKKLGKWKAKEKRDELYLTAVQLYCQGQTMTEIAPQIGYQRQDKVTYLLQLKDLRADIRHEMLSLLGDRLQTLVQQFRDPDQLQALDTQINSALGEQVAELMDKAEREATGARKGPLKSLLYQRISAYLERWSKVSA